MQKLTEVKRQELSAGITLRVSFPSGTEAVVEVLEEEELFEDLSRFAVELELSSGGAEFSLELSLLLKLLEDPKAKEDSFVGLEDEGEDVLVSKIRLSPELIPSCCMDRSLSERSRAFGGYPVSILTISVVALSSPRQSML